MRRLMKLLQSRVSERIHLIITDQVSVNPTIFIKYHKSFEKASIEQRFDLVGRILGVPSEALANGDMTFPC